MRKDIGSYADQEVKSIGGVPMDWLYSGYYKIRVRPRGPWAPIRVWLEDGERDPETWELLSDQILRSEWWPQTDSNQSFKVNPKRFFNRAYPITKEEFQWLLTIRTIPRKSRLQLMQSKNP